MPEPNKNASEAVPAANASMIMDELNKLKEQNNTVLRDNDQLRQTINQQQKMLTSPEFLQREPLKPEPDPPVINSPKDLMNYIQENVTASVTKLIDERESAILNQITPLLREATPEAAVWNKTQIAEKIVADEFPTLDMKAALELAEFRMQKQEIAKTTEAANQQKLQAEADALQASMGNRSTTSGVLGHDSTKLSPTQKMEAEWNKADMDAQTAQHEKDLDIWGAPETPGVKILLDNIPA